MSDRHLWLVQTVPHAFHGSDLVVHENGIVSASTGRPATDDEVVSTTRDALRDVRVLLETAFRRWSLMLWVVV